MLVLGPRQTGKSTLLKRLLPDLTINLALEGTYLEFSAHAAELESRVRAVNPRTVFIDEVQRLPSLLNTAQAIIDDSKSAGSPIRFFFTGSSARKLKRGKANLLPGRVIVYELGPLISAELDRDIDIKRALRVGLLPEPYLSADEEDTQNLLRAYAGTYLKEEIQAEALTQNLSGFSRFLYSVAECSGQYLDFSKLAQRSKLPRTSTVRFFEMLEDTLIASRVSPYPYARAADLVKHPRYFFFDNGVLNGLFGNFVASPDRAGMLFEHIVFNQLRVSARAHGVDCEIHNFRTRGGLELDFIVTMKGRSTKTWAIEVKSGSVHANEVAATFAQAKRYLPPRTEFVVATPGGHPRRLTHGRILPWQQLLAEMNL